MGRVPKATERRIRSQAEERCGYCLSSQKYVLGLLELEHILPQALGGTNREENIWLAQAAIDPRSRRGLQLIEHQVNHDPRDRHVHPQRESPSGNGNVLVEAGPEAEVGRAEDHRKNHDG